MKRIVLADQVNMGLTSGTAVMTDMLVTGQPIVSRPVERVDVSKNERWILFGAGRLFTRTDNQSSALFSSYGIKEPANYNTSAVSPLTLVNSTPIIVTTDGNIHNGVIGSPVILNTQTILTYNALQTHMDSRHGWMRHMSFTPGQPSERVFNSPLLLGSSLVYSSYLPSFDLCRVEGDGFVTAVNFRTGTAEAFGPFGSSSGAVFTSVSLGQGGAIDSNRHYTHWHRSHSERQWW
jgi:type IV pilus assembly protein PilY1